jgi:hypothetical protein
MATLNSQQCINIQCTTYKQYIVVLGFFGVFFPSFLLCYKTIVINDHIVYAGLPTFGIVIE